MAWRVICEGLSDDPCDWEATYRHRRDAETAGTSHANETGHAFSYIVEEAVARTEKQGGADGA